MIGDRLFFFTFILSLFLYANHALARVSNITFSDHPTTCSPLIVSWQGGVPPFTVVFLTVDVRAEPEPDGTIAGDVVRVADTGNARRVVWTAAIKAGKVLVAVVRDGLQQNFSSAKRVVQTSNDVTCLAALTSMDALTGSVALPTLSVRPIGPSTDTSSVSIRPTGTSTNLISSATVEASNSLNTNQRRNIALPVLLTLFTIGTVIGTAVYGLCIYRSSALRRSDTRYDDIEGGRYGGDTGLRILGTYSKELGRSITRKISAMSSQISRRPTAVVATEKPNSFNMLSEETSSPAPQEVPQPSSGSHADVVEPSSIMRLPIMPAHAIAASRPTSSVTTSTASGTTETGTGLSPPRPISTPHGKGLRPAPSRSSIRGQNRPLPKPPALDLSRLSRLSRQGPQRQYGLPTANNRQEAMRPRSRAKSAIIAEPNHKRSSTATRRRASAGAVAALDSPPAHFAQVPISALPPATPASSNIRPYSRVSGRPSFQPDATVQGSSRRRRSNTMGSILVVQDVPFVLESPTIFHFNQPTARSGAESPTSLIPCANVLESFGIPSSSPRSSTGSHVDPFYDIPQTARTSLTRYSMALPESGSLLPSSFSAAQDEVIPPLPSTSIPLSMLAKPPSRPISLTPGGDPIK